MKAVHYGLNTGIKNMVVVARLNSYLSTNEEAPQLTVEVKFLHSYRIFVASSGARGGERGSSSPVGGG